MSTSAVWSDWERDERNRSIRMCIYNGLIYIQYDNPNGAVSDRNGNTIGRDVARQLVLAADLTPSSAFTPRTDPAAQESPPRRTNQSDTGAASSGINYQYNNNPGQPSAGQNAQNPDGEDEAYLNTLPVNQRNLLERTGPPLTRDATADLRSLKTTGLLPPGYEEMRGSFFVLGRVFRVLWVEAKATTAPDHKRDDDVYQTLRPMIVVAKKVAHCICAPVYSNKGQGVAKSSLKEIEVQHHAIVHMKGWDAELTDAETKKWENKIRVKDAFTVEPSSNQTSNPASTSEPEGLSKVSRVRFDKPYAVGYHQKVLEIGRVIEEHRHRLVERWTKAMKS